MNKEDVKREIKSAFTDVVLGDGTGLGEAQAMDNYEPEEVQKVFREKDEKENWMRLTYSDLQRCHSSLSFFDAEGMRFHLPAYILASLEDRVDDPIFHLTRLNDFAKSKLTALNQSQRKAIAAYLDWCLEQDEYEFEHQAIERALSEYWEK